MGSEPIRTFTSNENLASLQIDGDDVILGGTQNIIVRGYTFLSCSFVVLRSVSLSFMFHQDKHI